MHTFLETLSENAQFVLLCLGITAGVLLLAWVSEKLVMRRRHRLNAAHTITTIAMLAAISGVLMAIEIPLFFAPSFYKLDFSELPVLICAFYLGPVSGVVCEFLKVLLKLLLKGTSTAFVGDLANFLVGCSFVLPAAIVYQKTLSKKGAVVSLAVGGDDGVRELLQRLVPHSPLRGHVRDAARGHRLDGHADQRGHHESLHAGAVRGRAVQPAQGRAGVAADVLFVQTRGEAVLPEKAYRVISDRILFLPNLHKSLTNGILFFSRASSSILFTKEGERRI